jgi:anti-sigma factor (TIGR02949 family)
VDSSVDDCREALHLLDRYVDGEIPDEDRDRLRRHLEACGGCADREGFVRRLREVIRRSCGSDPLPPGLEERVRSAIARIELSPEPSAEDPAD